MGARVLIDTNAAIAFLTNQLPDRGFAFLDDADHHITAITVIELLGVPALNLKEKELIKKYINDERVLIFEHLYFNLCFRIAGLRRDYGLKLPDAIIAATALAQGLPLVTRDADFKKVEGLQLINPFEL